MTKPIRSLALSAILTLILAACTIGTTKTPNAPNAAAADAAKIKLTVQADTSVPLRVVGAVIKYTYTIKNTGSAGVAAAPSTVSLTAAGIACQDVNTIGNKDGNLDPDESIDCTSTHAITQADLDQGSVTAITTATVNGIASKPVTTIVQLQALTLTDTANPVNYSQAGQQITYTYVIKNSGNTTLGPAQFTVNDNLVGSFNCGAGNTSLDPNATVTCTQTYTISQADLTAASIVSSATASGNGVGTSQPASTTITKSTVVQPNTNPGNLTAGSTIQHQVVEGEWLWQIARCYGADPKSIIQANPQLTNPEQISPKTVLNVPNIGSRGTIYGPPCVAAYAVRSGDTWNSIAQKYNADPDVLQMANGSVLSGQLTVPCNSAGGAAAACNSVGSPANPTPVTRKLTLTTTANPVTYSQAGQQITYTYVIKNSGNTTLGPSQFTVNDNLTGSFNCGAGNTSLAPNATVTCTQIYTISQDDVTAGSIVSSATASGGGAGRSQAVSITINKQ